jgi:hypothetical protein
MGFSALLMIIPLVLFRNVFTPPLDYISTPIFPLAFLFFLGGLLYFLWQAVNTWRRYSRDLSDGFVELIEGMVVQNPKGQGRYTTYSIQVAGQEFKVDGKTMLAFQNGGQYRVYYVPNSKTIVAAESLDGEKPKREPHD